MYGPIESHSLQLAAIGFKCAAPDLSPDAKRNNLPVLRGSRIGHAKDVEIGEVGRKNSRTIMQSLKGNDQDQNAFVFEPSIGMFKKYSFHAAIRDGTDFGVVRWIEIKKREGLWLGDRVKCITLDRLDPF